VNDIGIPLSSAEEQWAYTQAVYLQGIFFNLADACLYGFIIASTFAVICFLLSMLVHCACVRMMILLTRKGLWEDWFPVVDYEQAVISYTFYYIPNIVYNCLFVFLLFTFIIWLVIVVLWWKVSWALIWNWTVGHMIIKLVLPILINTVVLMIFVDFICSPDRIFMRPFFLALDVLECIIGVVASPLEAFMRVIFAFIFLVITLLRPEHSPNATWINNSLIQMDKCSKATAAVVKMARTHSNPTMWVFCDCLNPEKEMDLCGRDSHDGQEMDLCGRDSHDGQITAPTFADSAVASEMGELGEPGDGPVPVYSSFSEALAAAAKNTTQAKRIQNGKEVTYTAHSAAYWRLWRNKLWTGVVLARNPELQWERKAFLRAVADGIAEGELAKATNEAEYDLLEAAIEKAKEDNEADAGETVATKGSIVGKVDPELIKAAESVFDTLVQAEVNQPGMCSTCCIPDKEKELAQADVASTPRV